MRTIVSAAVIAVLFAAAGGAQAAEQRFGAVVVYADPIEAGVPAGEAFAAPSEPAVVKIAVESCRANTVKSEWSNCAVGRWIGTGQHLLVATTCQAVDEEGDPHTLLFFMQDGVTASDEQIRAEAQRSVRGGWIAEGGCRKVAVYDADKPARTEPEDSLVARSSATDVPRPAPASK